MAVINITPDSFSDGGKNFDPEQAVKSAVSAQENGADILDFGAQSTRPGYQQISDEAAASSRTASIFSVSVTI